MVASTIIIGVASRLAALVFWFVAVAAVGAIFFVGVAYFATREALLRLGIYLLGWAKAHLPAPRKSRHNAHI